VIVRKIADHLSVQWKQPVIVDNKPGGNGTVAMEAFINEPVGSSIYFAANDNVVAHPVLYNTEKYIKSLKPITSLLKSDLVLIAAPGISTWSDLVAIVGRNSSFGSWGVGSGGHVGGLELSEYFKTTGVHVPYRDYNQWFIDVNNKQLSYSLSTIASTSTLEKTGKLRYLAINSEKRDPSYPNVPTFKELTGQNFGRTMWCGFFAHTNMSDTVVNKLRNDIQNAIRTPEVQATLDNLKYREWISTDSEFKQQIKSDQLHFLNAATKYNITIK
jgi:tripartite-type tricarboxylate transporter receptor subunit TctC